MNAAGLGHLVPLIGDSKTKNKDGSSKKPSVKRVEVKATASASASDSEQWLEGTAFARTSSKKEKKSKKN